MPSQQSAWGPDLLGDGYQRSTIPLGPDPDGEGEIEATLVRYSPERPLDPPTVGPTAVLYVHGYTDYFFQRHVAEHYAARGFRFYALDLRKCGRSLRADQTPHFISDLSLYDAELDEAVRIVRDEVGGGTVLLTAHSTGGLILPLWLDRVRRRTGETPAGIAGVVLNSPWFDLQGPAYVRGVGTAAIRAIGRVRRTARIPGQGIATYGTSISNTAKGEWDYNLDWKPLNGFPVRFGWLRAIRKGQAELHRGLDIGVPSLILRSKLTKFAREYGPEIDVADAVLDVKQIQRWAGCLGERTTIVPVEGARHDVMLSSAEPLATALRELDLWLDWLQAHIQERITQ
ncbi:alpha/beta hydrolase [Antrihabitans cavernicola]|uniref:Alpha/beta hydrolase n=1 Tax=Antrihabitans cavernicola TaxID=2495913 RepID=A0A5A7SHJ0_9NOCA|nr:alpha/beta hydrolase [Spelaeibacter cavernicola]